MVQIKVKPHQLCDWCHDKGKVLGFIVSKEGKIPNPKKVQAIMNMLVPTNP
jgi:hypothetical protein